MQPTSITVERADPQSLRTEWGNITDLNTDKNLCGQLKSVIETQLQKADGLSKKIIRGIEKDLTFLKRHQPSLFHCSSSNMIITELYAATDSLSPKI